MDLELSESDNPIDNIRRLLSYSSRNNLPLYIFIDEYDNFITKLLISDINSYKNMVTDSSAIYKEFFTMLKVGTSGNDSAIKEIFITGVSPLALYDVTSGSNIGRNISLNYKFNDMVGVTKDELKELIEYYNLDNSKAIIERCNNWYNSYRFSEDITHTIYNSDMVLYYIDTLIMTNKEPRNLIDTNVRTDYSKLKYLVYSNNRLNGNFRFLNDLIEGKKVTTLAIKDNFSAFELSNIDNFKSFMFSLGFMTMSKNLFQIELSIPNQTIQKLLAEFIDYAYRDFENYSMRVEELNQHLVELALNKKLDVFNYIAEVIKSNSSLRDYIDGENFIKAYLLAYLNLNNIYEVVSEKESNKGYIDILLNPSKDEVPYGAMIELKYIKKSEYSEKLKTQKIKEAKEQLIRYDLGDRYIKIVIVFMGWEMVCCEEI